MLGYLIRDSIGNTSVPSRAPVKSAEFESEVLQLEHRLDALELSCAAMFKLLKEKHGYTTDELVSAIHEIDLADGKADGKMTRPQGVCPSCGHKLLSKTSNKCLWCGAPLMPASIG